MRTAVLDGSEIFDREQLHDELQEKLELPEWYGRNLDALYDCLTDIAEKLEIRLINRDALEEHLGNYAERLVQVLTLAALENFSIRVEFTA
ncbi:MAG: barstar family protein [Oscillospiraceae bacterium]|nr:barstar family protein [Oscillospiraceae bacterium]